MSYIRVKYSTKRPDKRPIFEILFEIWFNFCLMHSIKRFDLNLPLKTLETLEGMVWFPNEH